MVYFALQPGMKAGSWGLAYPLPVEDYPNFAGTVQHWLITAEDYDPVYKQFYITACRLGFPGVHPAAKAFPEATHQITIMAIAEDDALPGYRETPATLARYWTPGCAEYGRLPVIIPAAVSEQVKATDDEVAIVVPSLADAIVRLGWCPGSTVNPGMITELWRNGIRNSFDHIRGGHKDRT